MLLAILNDSVIEGPVELSAGGNSSVYVDMRRVTLNGPSARWVGGVMLTMLNDLEFSAVGGLTLGADPVATAIINRAAGQGIPLSAFVVRKEAKNHGTKQRIEGPPIDGLNVVIVDDAGTTGQSAIDAAEAAKAAGANVICVATLLDRGAGQAIKDAGYPYRAAFTMADLGLQ